MERDTNDRATTEGTKGNHRPIPSPHRRKHKREANRGGIDDEFTIGVEKDLLSRRKV